MNKNTVSAIINPIALVIVVEQIYGDLYSYTTV